MFENVGQNFIRKPICILLSYSKRHDKNFMLNLVSELHSAPNKILSHDFQQYKIKITNGFPVLSVIYNVLKIYI